MRITRTRRYEQAKNIARRLVPGSHAWHGPIDDRETVEVVEPVLMHWPDGMRKPRVGLVPDRDVYPYWTKYRQFLEANEIPFEVLDIHRSGWLAEACRFDIVVWRPMSFPSEIEECRRKLFILARETNVVCYPSFMEAMLYEDKLMQYELLKRHGFDAIETFISHSEGEALDFIASCVYPLVWKIGCGSGSFGVELVRDVNTARRRVRRVFSFGGRPTYWPYLGQKDYVYIQRLEPNLGWDLRVIVIGDAVFGYYRDVPKGEFRASGMGKVRWGALPPEAMRIARDVARAFAVPQLAVDMLADPLGGRISIIELSSFFQIDMPVELAVDDTAGMYLFGADDSYSFVPGVAWPQELALRLVLEQEWIASGRGAQEPPFAGGGAVGRPRRES